MLKDFECYKAIQSLTYCGNYCEQWEKRYNDGEIAKVLVFRPTKASIKYSMLPNKMTAGKINREAVRYAFEDQEYYNSLIMKTIKLN